MHLMCAKVKQPCLVQSLLLVLLLLKSHVNHAIKNQEVMIDLRNVISYMLLKKKGNLLN